MSILGKAVFALGLGLAAMAGLQHAGLFAVKRYVTSDAAQRAGIPVMKPVFAETKIAPVVLPKMPPIDTRAAQAAAISSYAHRIDLQNRAANSYVPLPSTYGIRR